MKSENKETMSLSKQRKLQRMHDIKKQKKEAITGKILGVVAAVAVAVGLIALVVALIVRASTKVIASNDYSAQLNENGTIKNVFALDCVTLPDYSNITIAYDDIKYSDEQLEAAIESQLEANAELVTSTDLIAKNGDKVNVDFIGSIDGELFDGSNTMGNGMDLTLGSGQLIDTFEQQIMGHAPGDNFFVYVTFPDEYPNNPSVAGKEAMFDVALNGIYSKPDFDDKFVLRYLGDYAITADGYRNYLREKNEEANLLSKINDYLLSNSTVNEYPKAYLKQIKAIKKYEDLANFEYMNNYYAASLGGPLYPTFSSYSGMSEGKYDRSLKETGQQIAKQSLVLQAIAEKEGIKANEDDYLSYQLENGKTEESFNNDLLTYGKAYLMQQHIDLQVLLLLKDRVTIQK